MPACCGPGSAEQAIPTAEEAWSLFENGLRGRIFDVALERLNGHRFNSRIGELVEVYRAHHPAIILCQDAARAIDFLQSRCRLGVISDGHPSSQRQKTDSLGLVKLVGKIILTGEHGEEKVKPALWPYEQLEKWADAFGSRCAYVGDNPGKDFVGARKLGWRTVRVRRPGGLHFAIDARPGFEADFEVSDLLQAVRFLGFCA